MPNLRRMRPIIIVETGVLTLLVIAGAVGLAKHDVVLKARVLEIVKTNGVVEVTLRITNSADRIYFLLPPNLEVWSGRAWKRCQGETAIYFCDQEQFNWDIAQPHATTVRRCRVQTFPSGTRLRVALRAQKYRDWPANRLFRLKFRLIHGLLTKPDDATPLAGADDVATSDDFNYP